MSFIPGLAHVPVSPFREDGQFDFDLYAKVLDFHLANGADSLAISLHDGESVSLSDAERISVLSFAVEHLQGRVPVIAHVSQSGTALAVELARLSEASGAAAILATTPYYWNPPPALLVEHLGAIGEATSLPFLAWNVPGEMKGKVTADIILALHDKLPNLIGLVDSSLDWQFMIQLLTRIRPVWPEFELISGSEYLISSYAIGARSAFVSLAGVAPRAVRRLYDLCENERFADGLKLQENISALRQAVKIGGPAGLKSAMKVLGRDCGDTRLPILPLDERQVNDQRKAIQAVSFIAEEPSGW